MRIFISLFFALIQIPFMLSGFMLNGIAFGIMIGLLYRAILDEVYS
jgi:hypothetical protein